MEKVLATAFVWALLMAMGFATIGTIFACFAFARRMHENARLAELYRNGQTPSNPQPVGGYTLAYKNGRKVLSMQIPGSTEQEAVAGAMRSGIPFDKIVSLTKN
jgi:hypothetical protein